MTVVRQSCVGTVGTNVSIASSAGGGTAFDVLVLNGASTGGGASNFKYDNALIATFGQVYAKLVANGSDYARLPIPVGGTGSRMRVPIYLEATPGATMFYATFSNSGGTQMHRFAITTALKVQSYRTSTSTGASGLSTAVLSLNTLYWIEFWFTKETVATNDGVIGYQLYQADGTTTVSGGASSVTAQATGTTDAANYRMIGGATGTNAYMFNLAGSEVPGSVIGPPSNALPTGTITANQNVAAGATVTVAVSATDSDGSIASYTWTGTRYTAGANPAAITIGTGSGTASITYTAGSAGSLDIWTCVVLDNSGGAITPTPSTEVRVLKTGTLSPLRMNGSGDSGYAIIGGSATEGFALNDASNTTRVETPDITSSTATKYWRLEPGVTRTGLRVTLSDIVLTAGITNQNKAKVRSAGTTVVTTRATNTLKKTSDDTTADVTTSDQTLYFDMTSAECTATDWAYVEVGLATGTV